MRRHAGRLVIYPLVLGAAVWLCVAWWSAHRARAASDALDTAWNAVSAGAYAEAATAAETAVALRPEDLRSWWVRGVALAGRAALERRAGDAAATATTTDASAAIDQACGLAAGDRTALIAIASSLLRVSALDLAATVCERVLALGPDTDALRLRGLVRWANAVAAADGTAAASVEARDRAEADFRAALEAAPDAAAAVRVGLAAAECGAVGVVGDATARILELDPADPAGPFLQGWEAERRSDPEGAERHLDRALELLAVRERSIALPSTDQIDQWRAIARECYGRRGRLRLARGDTKRAALDLTEALRVEPRWADVHRLAAKAFMDLGHLDAASASLRRAVQFGSNSLRAQVRDEVARGAWDPLPEPLRAALARGDIPKVETGPPSGVSSK